MKKIALLIFALTLQSHAANYYVWNGATGTGAGTSWTNAWTDFNDINFSTVSCGDTIWIAASSTNYTGSMSPGKTCTSGTVLVISAVLSTDSVPTSAAGYLSSMACNSSQQAINSAGSVTLSGSYWTITGRQGDAGSGVPYCLRWLNPTDGQETFVNPSSGTQNGLELTYVEAQGPACADEDNVCTGTNHALELDEGGATTLLVDHSWLHRESEVIHGPYETTSFTLQYSYVGEDAYVEQDEHEDWMYIGGDNCGSVVLNGNTWYSSGNDGVFIDNGGCPGNFVVTNNVFIGWGFWAISLGKTGTCGPYIIVNNTFANNSLGSDGEGNEYPYGVMGASGCTVSTSSIIANNIFYNTALDSLSNSYTTYNGGTTSNGNSFSCGTGCFSYSLASPIQNFTGFVTFTASGTPYESAIVQSNLHLSSAGILLFQGEGTNLTSDCSTYPTMCYDKDGNQRPTSGAWDLGAYNATSTLATPDSFAGVILSGGSIE